MHKCVLEPLKGVVDAALRDSQVSSGAWQQLRENLPAAKAKKPQELGVEGAVPPDTDAIEKIRQKFQIMCTKYSPEKKVAMLLRVCKRIYTIMQDNSGTAKHQRPQHASLLFAMSGGTRWTGVFVCACPHATAEMHSLAHTETF